MTIALLSVELFLPMSQSLKDKRMVLRRLKDRLGAFYGVHRSPTVQWLPAARTTLTAQLQREISTRLPLPLEDVYSIVREVRSRINVSLLRIL